MVSLPAPWLAAVAPAATLRASRVEQAVAVASGFALKPAYMLLSLALVALLWRRRDEGLSLVRRGLLAFFAGEAACAADYLLGGPGDGLEVLHGLGMVAGGALVSLGLLRILDDRVWHYTAREVPCSAVRFCGRCWKREPVSCGMQRLFLVAVPGVALLAALPLTAPLEPRADVIQVFGSMVNYVESPGLAWFQFRLLPIAALAAFGVSLAHVARGARGARAAQPWFFAGTGALLFLLLRFLLHAAFARMPIWGDFWEEATELAAILGVGVFLWSWRGPLGLTGSRVGPAAGEP